MQKFAEFLSENAFNAWKNRMKAKGADSIINDEHNEETSSQYHIRGKEAQVGPVAFEESAEFKPLGLSHTKFDDMHYDAKKKKWFKFKMVYCSHCGRGFGPGDQGYSHCEHHRGKKVIEESKNLTLVPYETDSEFDSKVKRVGKLAKVGPMKIVWDDKKKVYKNIFTGNKKIDD